MLKKSDRNDAMVSRIESIIHSFGGSIDQMDAVEKANLDADNWTGIKSVLWHGIDVEFSVSWELKCGGIIHVTAKKNDNSNRVKVTHEQRFFS